MKDAVITLYLKNKILYADKDATNEISTDAITYAEQLKTSGSDCILLYDLSEDDASREEALHLIADLCKVSALPIAGCCKLKRLEDVKKLIYAGCAKVIPDPDEEVPDDLLAEAAARFGADRVITLQQDQDIAPQIVSMSPAIAWQALKLNSDGLIPVVVQDDKTDAVLMVAYMNEEAYNETFRTGRMHYYSRSRNKLWLKGEESGHFQYVKSVTADCDMDTLLARVRQVGVACHTGAYSCFHNTIAGQAQGAEDASILEAVYATILDRKEHPKEGSYTNYLFDKGLDKILKKFGEEATEVVIASKNADEKEVVYELADVIYHAFVLMADQDISLDALMDELARRH